MLRVDPKVDATIVLAGSGAHAGPTLAACADRAIPTVVLAVREDRSSFARLIGHPESDVFVGEDADELIRGLLADWIMRRLEKLHTRWDTTSSSCARAVAKETVKRCAWQNAAIGAAVFIPGADMPLMTLNEAKMLLQIAAAYGQPLGVERIKELAVVVAGGFVFRDVRVRAARSFVPGFGWAIKGGIAYSGTMAMGSAAIGVLRTGGGPKRCGEVVDRTCCRSDGQFRTQTIRPPPPEHDRPARQRRGSRPGHVAVTAPDESAESAATPPAQPSEAQGAPVAPGQTTLIDLPPAEPTLMPLDDPDARGGRRVPVCERRVGACRAAADARRAAGALHRLRVSARSTSLTRAYRVALLYPDTYELGHGEPGARHPLRPASTASTGSRRSGSSCPWRTWRQRCGPPACRCSPWRAPCRSRYCDLLGITLPYELTCTNVLEALDLAGIPLHAADRGETGPVGDRRRALRVQPGAAGAFFDAFLIGEGEEAVARDRGCASRRATAAGSAVRALLSALREVPGVYVPSLYEPRVRDGGPRDRCRVRARPRRCASAPSADLDAVRPPVCPVVPFMDVVHDRATIEVLRGCTRGCRFCQAGMVYRPVRERSADAIVRDALAQLRCTGYEELSPDLALDDRPQPDRGGAPAPASVAAREGGHIGLPSLRVDAFGVAMARLVGEGAHGGLTFAPEAGTQRMRDVINKNVTEEDLLARCAAAFEAGWRRLKLYFMIGLPTETDEDVRGIGALVSKVLAVAREATPPAQRGGLRIAVSRLDLRAEGAHAVPVGGAADARAGPGATAGAPRDDAAQGRRAALARPGGLLRRGRARAGRPGRCAGDRAAWRRAAGSTRGPSGSTSPGGWPRSTPLASIRWRSLRARVKWARRSVGHISAASASRTCARARARVRGETDAGLHVRRLHRLRRVSANWVPRSSLAGGRRG